MLAYVIVLGVLALVFGVIERRWPAVRRTRRRGRLTDLVYWLTAPLVSYATTAIAVALIVIGLAMFAGGSSGVLALAERRTWFSDQALGLQVVLVFVTGDLLGYWTHRMFHRGRLWRFHAVHHSSQDLDWLSSVRVHPVNDVLSRVLQAVPLLALGFDTRVVAAFVPLIALYGIVLHANVPWTFGPLRYVIASPAFHRWHHTSEDAGLDKNFAGLFPIWDLVFGTFYLPARQPQKFGVRDPIPDGILGQLAWPFRSPVRRVRQ
jgi:sterol desaturase/sphingolipid hydroxylase (fatty acid hydroxylase superfamily)